MPGPVASTPCSALRRAVARDPSRPLVTHYGSDGSRVELSVRTLENGVAKAAGLLRDGLEVHPGDEVLVRLPAHWQTAVWLGACWSVGAVAVLGDPSGGVDVALVGPDDLTARAPATLAVSLHPFGVPYRDPLPAGLLDAAVEVRAHGDVFVPDVEPGPTDRALRVGLDGLTTNEVMVRAADLAARLDLPAGGRLLSAGGTDSLDGLLALLAVPLAVDGSVVLVPGDADADRLAAEERVDAVLVPSG